MEIETVIEVSKVYSNHSHSLVLHMSDNKSIWQQTDCFSFWHCTHHIANIDWHHCIQDYSKSTEERSSVSCDCLLVTDILPHLWNSLVLHRWHLAISTPKYPSQYYPFPKMKLHAFTDKHQSILILVEERTALHQNWCSLLHKGVLQLCTSKST